MLFYRQFTPSPTLSRFIECYWVCRAPSTAMEEIEPLIPGGRTELIFNFGNHMQISSSYTASNAQTIAHASIMGQRSRIYYALQRGDTNLLGVRFKPGGIGTFMNIPAALLLNEIVSAEDVLGTGINNWNDRLLEKVSDVERMRLLDQLLEAIIGGVTTEWKACNEAVEIIRADHSVTVRALCNEKESYYKKLERDFLKHVGYVPKHYSKIVRFNRAIRQMQSNKHSLTAICHACDYYDQSHFIKDFRQFTGDTPKRFQQGRHAIADFLIKNQVV